MRTKALNKTQSFLKKTYTRIKSGVRIDRSQILYNLRCRGQDATVNADAIEKTRAELEEIAKKNNIKIKVTSAFQKPFISIRRKGLQAIIDYAKKVFAGEFADDFKQENILKTTQNLVDNFFKK